MKTFLIAFIFFFSSLTFASTRAHFMGFQGMVQIFTEDFSGGSSPDAEILLKAMNVPSQGSVMGNGKTIQTTDKIMTMVCAQGPKGPQCTILLKASASVKMDPSSQTMQYRADGAVAEALREKFFLDPKGEFHLITSDGYFRVDVQAQSFILNYNGNGL